jgi:hypothetical protein
LVCRSINTLRESGYDYDASSDRLAGKSAGASPSFGSSLSLSNNGDAWLGYQCEITGIE